MTNYEKDIAICEAASEGPWDVIDVTKESVMNYGYIIFSKFGALGYSPKLSEHPFGYTRYTLEDARFIAHFNPIYIRELLEAVRERDELKSALDYLVTLKEYKDEFGKDAHYLEQKPLAWNKAKELLKSE